MQRSSRVVLFAGLMLLAAPPAVAADDDFTIAVSTDRRAYQLGDAVELLLTVANATSETRPLPYPCPCCVYEMWIENAAGEAIANEIQLACPQVTGEWTFGPFESRIFALHTWWQAPGGFPFPNPPPTQLVAPGTYRVVVEWHSRGRIVSAPFVICDGSCPEPRSLFLPAAGNNPGLHGTRWTTDLEIQGLGGGDAAVTLSLLAHGVANPDPATLEVVVSDLGTRRLANILGDWFDHNGQAALHVEVVGGDIYVASRTYNTDSSGTFGQAVPTVPAADARHRLLLPNLRHDPDRWRTNIGLVNLQPTSVDLLMILAPTGIRGPGPATAFPVTLAPHEYRQFNDVFAYVGATRIDQGAARIVTDPPGLAVAYASVIDNRTGDAVFVAALPDPTGE
jgi:hypothetical protein